MKHYKLVDVPAQQEQRFTHRTCDFCNKKIGGDCVDVEDVTIECRTGYAYNSADCGGTTLSVDMCADCFQDKLIPWVQSQDGLVNEESWR